MSPAGRPEKFPVKKIIGFDRRMLEAVDDWRRRQKDMPTVSEAIRRLVEKALVTGPAKAPAAPVAKAGKATTDDVPPKSKVEQIAALRRGR